MVHFQCCIYAFKLSGAMVLNYMQKGLGQDLE